ncbi:MAG: hypothetical protein JWQ25_2269, partial [Daejeonella sp.]|nr:hypothetical protein [Daejeonella sp.]
VVLISQLSISIPINNAGFGLSCYFNKYEIEESLDMMHVNIQATVLMLFVSARTCQA